MEYPTNPTESDARPAGREHAAACTCMRHPLPASMKVRAARDAYLAENGFTVEAYDAPRTEASFLGVKFTVPNTPRHRWAIMLHDLHHVVTGYGTDMPGEAEVSAWEARRGLRTLGAYVAGLVLSGAAYGALFAPRRAWRAARAPGADRSLFERGLDYEYLMDLSLGDLRAMLGIPEGGVTGARALHGFAPAAAPRECAAANDPRA